MPTVKGTIRCDAEVRNALAGRVGVSERGVAEATLELQLGPGDIDTDEQAA